VFTGAKQNRVHCRSAEGRRRIVAEIVRVLKGERGPGGPAPRASGAPPASSGAPFLPRPGAAPPAKARARTPRSSSWPSNVYTAWVVRACGLHGGGAARGANTPRMRERSRRAPRRPGAPRGRLSGRGAARQVRAFVDLVGSLLHATERGAAGRGGRGAGAPGLSGEVVRAMREAGVVGALTAALKLVDLDHPKARGCYTLPYTLPASPYALGRAAQPDGPRSCA